MAPGGPGSTEARPANRSISIRPRPPGPDHATRDSSVERTHKGVGENLSRTRRATARGPPTLNGGRDVQSEGSPGAAARDQRRDGFANGFSPARKAVLPSVKSLSILALLERLPALSTSPTTNHEEDEGGSFSLLSPDPRGRDSGRSCKRGSERSDSPLDRKMERAGLARGQGPWSRASNRFSGPQLAGKLNA